MGEHQWMTYREAAARLGMTVDAVRVKARRAKWLTTTDNSGRHRVSVPQSVLERSGALADMLHPERSGANVAPDQSAPEQYASGVPELVAALKDQVVDLKAALEKQERAAEARHIAEIERLVGQFYAERSFWTERSDAAEVRAERAEKMALDALTHAAETAERITAAMIQAADRPLWRRIFG